jgi:hypothetical protein
MVPFTPIVIFPINKKLQVRVTNLIGPYTTKAFGVNSAPSVATQFPASLIFRLAWRHNFRLPCHDNRFPRAGAEGAELILALSIFGHILRSTLVLLMPTD